MGCNWEKTQELEHALMQLELVHEDELEPYIAYSICVCKFVTRPSIPLPCARVFLDVPIGRILLYPYTPANLVPSAEAACAAMETPHTFTPPTHVALPKASAPFRPLKMTELFETAMPPQ